MSVLDQPHYHDEDAARLWLEANQWPEGRPVCPKCGEVGRAYRMADTDTHRGRYRCASPECRKDFSVTTGTLFERSHVPLHKWLTAAYLISSSKKGISAHQLHRTLGVTYRTAWFMAHRLREGMREGAIAPLGGEGKIVEADETYFGKAENPPPRPNHKGAPTKGGRSGPAGKRAVAALVERGGKVRTFHVKSATKAVVSEIVLQNVARESRLMSDESRLYADVGARFAGHDTVTHSAGEYVRGDAHTNTIEGYFGVFKRGMRGVYQHCGEKHLHRYLAEFDFRYNNRVALGIDDTARTARALAGIAGRRLTYRDSLLAVG
jgi:transposase-like protein